MTAWAAVECVGAGGIELRLIWNDKCERRAGGHYEDWNGIRRTQVDARA